MVQAPGLTNSCLFVSKSLQCDASFCALLTAPGLSWKPQIVLLHFCILAHGQSDQHRVINRTVIIRVGLLLKIVLGLLFKQQYDKYGTKWQRLSYLYATAFLLQGVRQNWLSVFPLRLPQCLLTSSFKCWLQTLKFFRFSIAVFSPYFQFFAAFSHCLQHAGSFTGNRK